MYVRVRGLSGSKPVAQAIVLRRVLMGGISTNRCLVARIICQYGFPLGGSGTLCGLLFWVVYGTLLGPEATGPGFWPWDFVSGFPAGPNTHREPFGVGVWGVWCGVVV